MQLLIMNKEEVNLHLFCKYVINKIKQKALVLINTDKYSVRDKILNEDADLIEFIGAKRKINCLVIIRQALNNLIYKSTPTNEYIIEINPNVYLYGTKTKIVTIVKLLEYGRLDLEPYPMFRKIFDEIAEHLPDLYLQFIK